MILLDWSQIVISSSLAVGGSDLDKGKDPKKAMDIIRHATLTSLQKYRTDYSKKYGELVICADGWDNWRRKYFPNYKAVRKVKREDSKTDWKMIFTFASDLLNELRETFPYRVVHVGEAEGDDVIAVLTKYVTENKPQMVGLVEEPEDILIVSNDNDYKQLHKYKNVRQWNPLMKKYVTKAEPDFLLEKVIKGDPGDGVPNVLSGDNAFVDAIRQKPVTSKVMEKFKTGTGLTDTDKRNFQRNQTLIDFDFIPEDVTKSIIDAYEMHTPKRDLNAIMNYLIKNRCRLLLDNIQGF
jgi:hypothetical protein